MKKSIVLAITILIALFGMYAAERDAAALDAPHNTNNQSWSITCSRCHYSPAGPTPTWVTKPTSTDDTFKNNLCKDCHSASGMPAADPRYADVQTHSATQTASAYWGGNWTVECTVCHSPHYQSQSTNASFGAEPGVNVLTGTVSSIASTYGAVSSSLTDTSAAFPVDGYVGYLLVPDVNAPTRVYRISANDSTTITVDGAININYAGAGDTYAIRYGKLVNTSLRTPNSGTRLVKFFNAVGSNSFGSGVNGVCQVCHTQTTSFKNDGTKEAGAHPAGVAETQACTECHAHSVGFKKGGCTNCHGSPPADASTLVFKDKDDNPVTSDSAGAGAHVAHTTAGRLKCENCHTGGMLSGASQGDNQINLGLKLGSTAIGGNYDAAVRTVFPVVGVPPTTVSYGGSHQCSNVYCHSSGQSFDGSSATPVYGATPPSWLTSGSGQCGTCHGTTAATITSGNHAQHLAATGLVAGCGECHTGAANDASSYTSTNHVNKLIDVANNYNAGGTPGNGYGSCVATACHGSGTPNWGTSTAGMDKCTLCHGTPTAGSLGSSGAAMAPPADTARASSGAKVGAHQAHLVANSIGRTVACAECHDVPATVATNGHIKDLTPGAAEVPFSASTSTVARANGASPSYSSGSCSSVYCHGANQWKGTTEGANMTPSWADTGYINGTASHDCGQCHGYPPAAISAHTGKGPNDCVDCHNNTNGSGTGFTNVAMHVNGALEVSGCNGCHGQSGPTGAPLVLADLLSGPSYTPTHAGQTQPGAHNRHVTSTELNMSCSICHAGHTMPDLDSEITMSFSGVAAGGAYDGKTLNAGYSYSGNVTLGTPGTLDCNNLYCHSSGQSAAGTTPPVYANPNWETSSMTCGSCHKNMDTDATAPGSHAKHAQSAGIACATCHNGYTETSYAQATHVNQTVNVSFSGAAAGTLYTGGSTSGNHAAGGGYGSCFTSSCHSSGQSDTGTASPLTYGNPTWGDTLNCGSCHKNMDTDASAPGSHVKHAQDKNISCAICHSGYTETSVAAATHNNGTVNTTFGGVAAGTLYTGGTTSGNHALGGGYGTCYTSDCHSSGQSPTGGLTPLTYGTPTWGGAVNCGSCHKNMDTDAAAPGSHVVHAQGTLNLPCATCHNGYTETSVGGAHMNTVVNTSFTGTAAGTLYTGGTTSGNHALGRGYGTCFTNQCHGASDPTWGANTTNDTCTKCHGTGTATVTAANKNVVAPPTSVAGNTGTLTGTGQVSNDVKVGAHQTHLLYSNGVRTTGAETIENRCEFCHGTLPTTGMHADGSSTPAFQGLATRSGAMSPAPTYGGTSCNNTYCHNPAGTGGLLDATSAGTGTVPSWTDAAYIADAPLKTEANCGRCHKVPTATPDPTWYAMSTHSTYTIGSNCAGCHGHNGGSTGAVGQRHMDGIRYASGDCNSCHDYDVVGATYAGGVWSGGSWGKNSQDGLTPNEGWGAHAKHINHVKTKLAIGTALDPTGQTFGSGTPASICGVCHTNTAGNHSMGGDVYGRLINFGDGSTTYQFGASAPLYSGQSGTSSATTLKTCSNLSCHFKATPIWSTY